MALQHFNFPHTIYLTIVKLSLIISIDSTNVITYKEGKDEITVNRFKPSPDLVGCWNNFSIMPIIGIEVCKMEPTKEQLIIYAHSN